MTDAVNSLILSNLVDKIVIADRIFDFLDKENPELVRQEGVYFWRDAIRARVGNRYGSSKME